ncbi:MAG: ATP-grasp domain-containing protein [Planctomycetes bacterium]|nr:ATP-grasp domain-containing protein [Planctomycetota bacterium]
MKAPEHGDGNGTRIGIFGGGQLALMLADAARASGKQPLIMAASVDEPAVVAGHAAVIGRQDIPEDLDRFLARVDLVTIENEFLDLGRIGAALSCRPEVGLYPGTAAIALAQDKLAQKWLFGRLGIPTAQYSELCGEPLDVELARLRQLFPEGFVLKWSRFGYDGRGNLVVDSARSPSLDAIERFCRAGRDAGAAIYAEALIDFQAELAMVSARGRDAAQVFMPLVTTRQERGVCREVRGPAVAFGHASELEQEAREHLTRLGAELDFVGAFAVEFFVDRQGRLLVNEMAPRVHNSGHFSLWRDEISQFDLHVRAICGATLEPSSSAGIALMRNILGPEALVASTPCAAPPAAPSGTVLHWYGKKLAARGRKMGHLTARAPTPESATQLSAAMADWESQFWNSATANPERKHDRTNCGARSDHHGVGI